MSIFNRRNFLKTSGLSFLPAFIPAPGLFAKNKSGHPQKGIPNPANGPEIFFFYDGIFYEPAQYIEQLQKANTKHPIEQDFYGSGGAVASLEKKFEEITGKEKAIYMPSGTMANQLAIAVLSGEKTKVFVQDTSHVYRDEADAAQSVFQKRLMPLATDQSYFTVETLKQAVESLHEQEVFTSGIGAVSIENPVRRANGRMVLLEEIKKISTYCRSNNIKLHLDGARIFIASAWSGISIKEYASYFDTIYISLYKYLGAAGGAILCGDTETIEKMPHLVKIHGGNMFGNWPNAAMALHRLEGIEDRFKETIKQSITVFDELNKLPGVKVSPLKDGTNIYTLELAKGIDAKKLRDKLRDGYNIYIGKPGDNNQIMLTVNETLLSRNSGYVADAFKNALKA